MCWEKADLEQDWHAPLELFQWVKLRLQKLLIFIWKSWSIESDSVMSRGYLRTVMFWMEFVEIFPGTKVQTQGRQTGKVRQIRGFGKSRAGCTNTGTNYVANRQQDYVEGVCMLLLRVCVWGGKVWGLSILNKNGFRVINLFPTNPIIHNWGDKQGQEPQWSPAQVPGGAGRGHWYQLLCPAGWGNNKLIEYTL